MQFWMDTQTGALLPYMEDGEGNPIPGFEEPAYEILEAPAGFTDGSNTVTWSMETRAFVPIIAVAPVPTSVTPLQIRKAIRQQGLKSTVDAFVLTLDEEIVEAWEYATIINRTDPFITLAIAGLGWTDTQADALFSLAATL